MKEKRKKIIARVGAMVAAVLLVALCALPAFADGVEEQSTEGFIEPHVIIENTFGLVVIDPLYKLINSGYNYSLDWLYQFKFAQVGATIATTQIVTYSGMPYTGAVCVVSPNGELLNKRGWWETSHTTRDGNKYVYFDWVSMTYEDDFPVQERLFRFRMVIEVATGQYLRGAFESDYYPHMNSENISDFVIATAIPKRVAPVIQYGIGRGLLEVDNGVQVYYPNFERIYDYGTDNGYEVGYTNGYRVGYDIGEYNGYNDGWLEGTEQGKQLGYNEGYDDGMSQSSLIDGVTAIFRAPMELINSVLNFEILGINMAVAVRVLISMAILGVVITFIWKAVK